MSIWNVLEEQLLLIPVRLELTENEMYIIESANLQCNSRMSILEAFDATVGKTSLSGLSDEELKTIKQTQTASGIKAVRGESGFIIMVEPKKLLDIKHEIEGNQEFYHMMLRGEGEFENLMSKINNKIHLAMGSKKATAAPMKQLPDLSIPDAPDEMDLTNVGDEDADSRKEDFWDRRRK